MLPGDEVYANPERALTCFDRAIMEGAPRQAEAGVVQVHSQISHLDIKDRHD